MQRVLLHLNLRRITQAAIIGILPLVLTAGCIVIPIPTGEKPYYEGAIPGLETGITSKEEVISKFGLPDAIYTGGSELVYIDTVENLKIAWGFILVGPYGGGGAGGGLARLHKRHVLLLSFDEKNVLTRFELDAAGDDFGDCTDNGICFDESTYLMRYADESADAAAKEFRAVAGMCSIYLHGLGNKNAYEVSLGGNIPVNVFSTRAFIHWTTEPGHQEFVTWPENAFMDYACEDGEIVFLHFDYRRTGPSRLRVEDRVTGRENISSRRLVLLPEGSEGLSLAPPVPGQE